MKIVFLGSAHFAQVALKSLIASEHQVVCVVTQQDRKQDRGMSLRATPVKDYSLENRLEVFQPADINSEASVRRLAGCAADLFVVIAYGQKLSRQLLDLPRIMSVNIHASLLPRYRGAAPINWALINGETTTGVSSMKMVTRMDAGPLIMQKKIAIGPDATAETLELALADAGASVLQESLSLIEKGAFRLIEQDETLVSHAPKLKKADGCIQWGLSAERIINLVRGCQPWPGAFTYYKGKMLKVFRCHPLSGQSAAAEAGEIVHVTKQALAVRCADAVLSLDEVQVEGGKRMSVSEFIAGHKVCAGEKFLLQ